MNERSAKHMKKCPLHKTQFENKTIEISFSDIAARIIESWMLAAQSFIY